MIWKKSTNGIWHLVVNRYYICNHAVGKHYEKQKYPLPSVKKCCKRCLYLIKKTEDKEVKNAV